MAMYSAANASAKLHKDGHVFGDRSKRTSIGDGKRKRRGYKNRKKYRGQGR